MCAHDGSHLCAWDSAEQRSAQCDGAEQRNSAEQLCAQDGAQFDAAISASGMYAQGGSQLDATAQRIWAMRAERRMLQQQSRLP